jgi:hypothetical protein
VSTLGEESPSPDGNTTRLGKMKKRKSPGFSILDSINIDPLKLGPHKTEIEEFQNFNINKVEPKFSPGRPQKDRSPPRIIRDKFASPSDRERDRATNLSMISTKLLTNLYETSPKHN